MEYLTLATGNWSNQSHILKQQIKVYKKNLIRKCGTAD